MRYELDVANSDWASFLLGYPDGSDTPNDLQAFGYDESDIPEGEREAERPLLRL